MLRPSARLLRFNSLLRSLSMVPGEFPSLFKGEGQEFVDLRPHQPGDDFKNIHWASLAKTGSLYTIQKEIPKSLTVILARDFSASCFWGKKQTITELFLDTMIASLAWRGNNFFGFAGFTDRIEKYIPPRPGTVNFFAMKDWGLSFPSLKPKRKTSISNALSFLLKEVNPRSVVFFVSDFFDKINFGRELKLASERFDFIPVVIQDPNEFIIPRGFRAIFESMESRSRGEISTVQAKEWGAIYTQKLVAAFRSRKIEPIILNSAQEDAVVGQLKKFLQKRRSMKRQARRN